MRVRNRERDLLRRDGRRCHYCRVVLMLSDEIRDHGIPAGPGAFTTPRGIEFAVVDHKIPRARGGSNNLGNLVLACTNCNSTKGTKSYFDFLWGLVPGPSVQFAQQIPPWDKNPELWERAA